MSIENYSVRQWRQIFDEPFIRLWKHWEWEWQEVIEEVGIFPYGIPIEDKPRNFYELGKKI